MVVASVDVRRVGSALPLPGRGRGLLCEGLDDPDRSGMVAAALDAVRGFQVLARLCSGQRTAIYGNSQGATLGIAVGSLCPDAGGVVAGVPILVNLRHNLPYCATDPYVELRWHFERHPEQEAPGLRTLSYLDPRFFLPRLPQPCLLTLAPDDDVTTFVNVGRLSPEKNQTRLIRAFASVHAENPKTRLLIVGSGPLAGDLEALVASLGLTGSVFLTGMQRNPHAIMAKADCFVLSSDYEGQPMVILEALVLGLPIVTVEFASAKNALPEGSGLVVPQTEEGVADGLRAFLAGRVPASDFDWPAYNRKAVGEFYRAIGAVPAPAELP